MSDETRRTGLSLAGAFLLAALAGLSLVWIGRSSATADPAADRLDPARTTTLAVFPATHGETMLADPHSG